jgi:diguanylate cyclase (GGDEF)-like protein
MRNTDTLYRIGGEEFIIICKNTTEPEVIKFAEKLRIKIESSVNIIEEKTITVSIGVTEVFSNDTKDSIYKRVDDNLYHSKNNGKNKVSTDISMNI